MEIERVIFFKDEVQICLANEEKSIIVLRKNKTGFNDVLTELGIEVY